AGSSAWPMCAVAPLAHCGFEVIPRMSTPQMMALDQAPAPHDTTAWSHLPDAWCQPGRSFAAGDEVTEGDGNDERTETGTDGPGGLPGAAPGGARRPGGRRRAGVGQQADRPSGSADQQ